MPSLHEGKHLSRIILVLNIPEESKSDVNWGFRDKMGSTVPCFEPDKLLVAHITGFKAIFLLIMTMTYTLKQYEALFKNHWKDFHGMVIGNLD